MSIHHVFYLELLSLQLRSSRDSEMHKEKAPLLLHQGEMQFEAQAFTTVVVKHINKSFHDLSNMWKKKKSKTLFMKATVTHS